MRWGFDPAPKVLVDKLGPKVVSARLSAKILKDLNTVRSGKLLVAKIKEAEGKDAKYFSARIANALIKERRRLEGFQNLEQVAAAPLMTSTAFVVLVDSYKYSSSGSR